MKNILLILIIIISFTNQAKTQIDSAQIDATQSAISISLDLQSRYIWRGIQLGGNSPSVQPSIEYSYGNLSIGAWGAYSFGGVSTGQEADLYLSYSLSSTIAITLSDYYFPTEGLSQDYFNYTDNTNHVYEAMISYANVINTPLSISLATNIGGADKNGNDQAYSTYLEASYGTSLVDADLTFFLGGVIGDSGGYYLTEGEDIINVGLTVEKEIQISESFSLPVNASLIFNPNQNNIYLTFGLSI